LGVAKKEKVPDVLRARVYASYRSQAASGHAEIPPAPPVTAITPTPPVAAIPPALPVAAIPPAPPVAAIPPTMGFPMPNMAPPNYSMQGYPYGPMYLPQYPFYPPWTPPSRNHRDDSSDLPEEAERVAVDYPLVLDWLQSLVSNPIRGRDKIDYTAYAEALTENEVIRLDDITLFKPAELCDLAGMKMGTAARIYEWAKVDKEKIDGHGRKGKKSHR
jgi:hypothetical protein